MITFRIKKQNNQTNHTADQGHLLRIKDFTPLQILNLTSAVKIDKQHRQ